jgi:hypothetical protein
MRLTPLTLRLMRIANGVIPGSSSRLQRAELARFSDDDATRRRELREAHRLFLEVGAPIRAEQVAKELAG